MPHDPKAKIIVALDVPDASSAELLLDHLGDAVAIVKVGLQLFTAQGPEIVRRIQARGLRIFLDLKFHDIPNTARHAVASARDLGVEMTTIHLAGGPAMIAAAVEEAADMLILGVTVLTSMDEEALASVGIRALPSEQVLALAQVGVSEGVCGVVASPEEIEPLRMAFGTELRIVCPGVRPRGAARGDQSRVATPAEAIQRGADFLVIGRPVAAAADPRGALAGITKEVAAALG